MLFFDTVYFTLFLPTLYFVLWHAKKKSKDFHRDAEDHPNHTDNTDYHKLAIKLANKYTQTQMQESSTKRGGGIPHQTHFTQVNGQPPVIKLEPKLYPSQAPAERFGGGAGEESRPSS